jgi:hypothetical protein
MGESGLEISDWWPHVAASADDLAVVRSMWTTDNNHGALQFLRPAPLEGSFRQLVPGSTMVWVLSTTTSRSSSSWERRSPIAAAASAWLELSRPRAPRRATGDRSQKSAPVRRAGADVYREEQQEEFALLGRLNRLAAVEYPDDPAVQAPDQVL